MFGREEISYRSSNPAGSAWRVVLLALALACAVALPGTAQSDRAQELFRRFDADSDGRISRMEFELRKVEIIFSRSRSEGAQIKFEDTRLSRAAFDAIDTNGDGVITASEVTSAPFFAFDNFDTSGDGYIDLEEFRAMISKIER
jgi:Ca2+-binding EF-hand superfamily protein